MATPMWRTMRCRTLPPSRTASTSWTERRAIGTIGGGLDTHEHGGSVARGGDIDNQIYLLGTTPRLDRTSTAKSLSSQQTSDGRSAKIRPNRRSQELFRPARRAGWLVQQHDHPGSMGAVAPRRVRSRAPDPRRRARQLPSHAHARKLTQARGNAHNGTMYDATGLLRPELRRERFRSGRTLDLTTNPAYPAPTR